ncbi:tRNA(Met) cytidine acetyltransferase TmcA domain-containing protein, partial [Kaarinaea lacus]
MFDLIPGAAGLSPELPVHADIAGLASVVIKDAGQSHQRRMLVLAGEAEWSREIAKTLMPSLAIDDVTWVSSAPSVQMGGAEVVSGQGVKRLLGQERDVVIFDAHSGFDPDAFGAVSGIIRGGGLLVLLCPPLSQWQQTADPACERIAISPFSYRDISGRFIHRLVNVIREAKGTCIVEQGKPLPALPLVATPSITPKIKVSLKDGYAGDPCVTADQQAAVEAIMHVVYGHRRRPAVLVSNRGRGKTTALGIAAARLVQDARSRTDHSKGFLRIVVTAPQRASVDALFSHARQLLEDSQLGENCLTWQGSEIQYIAPDVLSDSMEDADLVLVDEA